MKHLILSVLFLKELVTATVYHAVVEQTDDTPFVTASMKHINPNNPAGHRWIAVSRDLEELGYSFGTKVCIEGINKEFDGDWTVQDRMNKRFTKRIDLLVNVGTMGKWNNIKIELNEYN
jgi:3D (Asp-Asp-Asp) domain-containing protein